jgi:CTP:molybdopterin cytidylyltransferase MocA/SAM-dependent methyltransferase
VSRRPASPSAAGSARPFPEGSLPRPFRVGAVVLAAGRGTRFGGEKLAALLGGRPILAHVVDALVAAGLAPIVVVVGPEGVPSGLRSQGLRMVVNPHPEAGLAVSLRSGLAVAGELTPPLDAVVVALGDQPLVRPEHLRHLVAAGASLATGPGPGVVASRYREGGGPNPVLLLRRAWWVVEAARGDRGLAPWIRSHPEAVAWVDAPGDNPDVDTTDDLDRLARRLPGEGEATPGGTAAGLAAAWGARVRANRQQVDRHREVPDGPDFYAPVSHHFRADPDRRDDPVLDALVGLARPEETWLDIGAGAGRYALPLARRVAQVVAVDRSPAMLAALAEEAAARGIGNVRIVVGSWPPDADLLRTAGPLAGDVALIAHVGYDIEEIEPFLAAMERAARRLCVAVLMEAAPAALADPFWPPIHGEERVPLPALPDFLDLLRARRCQPQVTLVDQHRRIFRDLQDLHGYLRRQLWLAEGSEKDRRLAALLPEAVEPADGGVRVRGVADVRVGIVTWRPPPNG